MTYAYRRLRGFGLIELMIAMTLSLIIGIAITQIFLSQKNTFKAQDELGRMQENARFAFDAIGRDLRMAGYWSCNPSNAKSNPFVSDSHQASGGPSSDYWFENFSATPKMPNGNLKINFVDVSRPIPFNINAQTITRPTDASAVKVASDCGSSYVFTGSSFAGQHFDTSMEVFPLEMVSYVVSNRGLYRTTASSGTLNSPQPENNIIDKGVSAIKYSFGKASGTYVTSYVSDTPLAVVSAWSDADWQSVASVKVTLALQGDDITIPPKEFTSVITIRNRLP